MALPWLGSSQPRLAGLPIVWSPVPARRNNLKWLAGFRHPRYDDGEVAETAPKQIAGPYGARWGIGSVWPAVPPCAAGAVSPGMERDSSRRSRQPAGLRLADLEQAAVRRVLRAGDEVTVEGKQFVIAAISGSTATLADGDGTQACWVLSHLFNAVNGQGFEPALRGCRMVDTSPVLCWSGLASLRPTSWRRRPGIPAKGSRPTRLSTLRRRPRLKGT